MVRAKASSPSIRKLLSQHPFVELISGNSDGAIDFFDKDRWRSVLLDAPSAGLYGLTELVDNNPLVCADQFSVPSWEGTLALIGLGPLIRAGILLEEPTGVLNGSFSEDSVKRALASAGWTGGFALEAAPEDSSVRAAVFYAVVSTPPNLGLIDELYEGIYGASFFVRLCDDGEWAPPLVSGMAYAIYRLRVTPDEPTSLLTIRVMGDSDGKCGAAQVVHAMNVMCGFEESLGIE